MDAAVPHPDNGYDPFAALTQRFAAMDAAQEAQYSKAKEALKNGKAAVSKLKRTAERAAAVDSSSKTRLCIKAFFSESDEDRCDEIEEAAEQAAEKRHLPVTEVLDPSEVRARLDAAVKAREFDSPPT